MMNKIRVLIVDDSAFIRRVYRDMLEGDPEITVVGAAADPYEAREMIKKLNPDVVTLDIEMPKMDGLDFLEKIMTLRPMPVVMSSTLTQKGAEATIQALELGAVEVVSKPLDGEHAVLNLHEELVNKVKIAAKAEVKAIRKVTSKEKPISAGTPKNIVIAIGASTGGVETLNQLLGCLPGNMPPIVIVQHMPPYFTKSFASRLNNSCALTVKEAVAGEILKPSHVYIAPGDRHMEISQSKTQPNNYVTRLNDSPEVSGHKPSVDVLFHSVSQAAGKKAVGVILTGMGKDGARGLLEMRESGAKTLGQNEKSCVIYGMPKAAKMLGGVERELPLADLPRHIIDLSLLSTK